MQITSMTFLFIFLPIALALYYFVDSKAKELLLLLLSLLFYAIGSIEYIILFTAAVLLTVLIGRGMDSRADNALIKKCLLCLGIIINILILAYYKYRNNLIHVFAWWNTAAKEPINDSALPLGISFFTFKSISYLVDVYRGRTILSENPLHDALYLSLFTQIQSGPLSRYSDMSLENQKHFDMALFSDGIYRFMVGFNKKVLIANVLSNVTLEIYRTPCENISTAFAWLGSICYSLQLFLDFSGYSDMAIGLTQMFGYHCPENFKYPYITESVSRFWRRWHITLSEWFRDYVYIPLGGSRNKNKLKVYFNLLIVWILTGIWHGAAWNFIAWGLGFFVVISLERIFNLPGRFKSGIGKTIYRIISLLFINFQWVIFNSTSLNSGFQYIGRMVLLHTNELSDMRTLFLIKDYKFFIIVAIILSVPVIPAIEHKSEKNHSLHVIYEATMALIVTGAFVWAISYVVAGQNNPFAYANF